MEKVKHKGNLVVYCDPDISQGITAQMIQHIINDVSVVGVRKSLAYVYYLRIHKPFVCRKKLGFKRYGREPKSIFDGHRYYDEDQ